MLKILQLIFLIILFPLFAESHQILVMLTNPRSVSSAFEKSMISRGDFKIVDEPWVASHMLYNGDEQAVQSIAARRHRQSERLSGGQSSYTAMPKKNLCLSKILISYNR